MNRISQQPAMPQHGDKEQERRTGRRNLRLAIALGVLAFLIYVGFFFVSASHG